MLRDDVVNKIFIVYCITAYLFYFILFFSLMEHLKQECMYRTDLLTVVLIEYCVFKH